MLFIWESNKREKEQTTVRTKTANKDGKKKKIKTQTYAVYKKYTLNIKIRN